MNTYTARQFNIPELAGISKKQVEEHLKLYAGYVTHVGVISARVKELTQNDREKNTYEIHELWRRLGFEFNGMRNHEYYFGALESGSQSPNKESAFSKAAKKQFGSFKELLTVIKEVGATRGSGWVLLYYDRVAEDKPLIVGWVDEHHLGYLSSLPVVFAMDCWEHAYMVDYLPSERGVYIDAYLNSVNWGVVETWFENIIA